MIGMWQSMRTTAKRSAAAAATASAPSLATSTRWPRLRSISAATMRLTALSSTTRIATSAGARSRAAGPGAACRLRRARGGGLGLGVRLRQRQVGGEPERAAAAGLAVGADLATHHLHQLAADAQPQAGPAVGPRGRRVGLVEGLEQARDGGRLDPDAGVGDLEAHALPAPRRLALGHAHGDRAL